MRDEGLYLEDILDATRSIEQFLKHVSKADFLESDLLQSAVLQKLSVIGEAASKVSKQLKSRYPDVQWKKMIGARNVLIHMYFAADWDVIWKTAKNDIPVLNERIDSVLRREFPTSDKG